MEHADLKQCHRDNIMVAAHFATSSVFPPVMREERCKTIHETLPSWPGQSVFAAKPKLGSVRLVPLHRGGEAILHLPDNKVRVQMNVAKGWYRGRWLLQIDSVNELIARCQHYATGPLGGNSASTTWAMLLRLGGLGSV